MAVCSGRDIRVELPDGRKDWVGDSARRAVRASGCCFPNEILLDEPVRYHVFRDFNIMLTDIKQRPLEYQPKKMEEVFTLYVSGELRPEVAAGSEVPEYFVYTLSIIGKVKEAAIVAQQVSERLGNEASRLGVAEEEALQRILRSWNRLMASLLDYSRVLEVLKSIRAVGLSPNVVTYNTLINKAPDYDTAKPWVDKMVAEGIQPDVVTYSTLFSKDLSSKSADDILEWYLAKKYHPEVPIQAAIVVYRKIRRIDQALRLALDYPHLQAARKLIREHDKEALSYFGTISDQHPQHPNADYALGVALMELGKELEAQPHLKKALKLAKHKSRKTVIREWLRQIDRILSQKR